jgi:predicted nucleic acid-binding protein
VRQYLLDTGPLGGLLFARPPALAQMGTWVRNAEAHTSALSSGELVEYVVTRADAATERRALLALLDEVVPLYLDLSILDRYADLRLRMRPPHGPGLIGDIDTLIAATALERDLTLVTTDRDSLRIPDLRVLLLAPRTFVPVSERP